MRIYQIQLDPQLEPAGRASRRSFGSFKREEDPVGADGALAAHGASLSKPLGTDGHASERWQPSEGQVEGRGDLRRHGARVGGDEDDVDGSGGFGEGRGREGGAAAPLAEGDAEALEGL